VLICGSAGCGKTLFGAQFIVKGITDYNEPGVFMTFEESASDLAQNVLSLGFDLEDLKRENKLRVDHVRIERSEIEETENMTSKDCSSA
jgi:circadian clock protein KaiC